MIIFQILPVSFDAVTFGLLASSWLSVFFSFPLEFLPDNLKMLYYENTTDDRAGIANQWRIQRKCVGI